MVRVFLAIVANYDLECDQMDVVTAFLNGELNEKIYMETPEGFRDSRYPYRVCKSLKALYGLKQAPRQWFEKINDFLCKTMGFSSDVSEPCIYFKHGANSLMMIALYVDDLLIAGNNRTDVNFMKLELRERFKMKDLGEASEFLGIKIVSSRKNSYLHITQQEFTERILRRFSIEQSRPSFTPMEVPAKKPYFLSSKTDEKVSDFRCRQAIGSLMYLMLGTHPDIAFAVGKISQ